MHKKIMMVALALASLPLTAAADPWYDYPVYDDPWGPYGTGYSSSYVETSMFRQPLDYVPVAVQPAPLVTANIGNSAQVGWSGMGGGLMPDYGTANVGGIDLAWQPPPSMFWQPSYAPGGFFAQSLFHQPLDYVAPVAVTPIQSVPVVQASLPGGPQLAWSSWNNGAAPAWGSLMVAGMGLAWANSRPTYYGYGPGPGYYGSSRYVFSQPFNRGWDNHRPHRHWRGQDFRHHRGHRQRDWGYQRPQAMPVFGGWNPGVQQHFHHGHSAYPVRNWQQPRRHHKVPRQVSNWQQPRRHHNVQRQVRNWQQPRRHHNVQRQVRNWQQPRRHHQAPRQVRNWQQPRRHHQAPRQVRNWQQPRRHSTPRQFQQVRHSPQRGGGPSHHWGGRRNR